MMEKQVIFFPKTMFGTRDLTIQLLGFIKLIKNVRYYFILPNHLKNTYTEHEVQTIGHFTRMSCLSCLEKKASSVLCITETDGNLNANISPGQIDNFLLVIYDPSRLYDYGTSLETDDDSQKLICFIILSKWLCGTEDIEKQDRVAENKVIHRFTEYLLVILNMLVNSVETKFVQLTILRLTLFKHVLGVIKNYVWLIETFTHNKQILPRAKAINYLISCICDAVFGITILYLLNTTYSSSNELFSYISNISHVIKFICICLLIIFCIEQHFFFFFFYLQQVIKVLQGTLQWLMGSPAGLKLNDPLNSLLGTCFLYLVNLWWSFLGNAY